MKRAFILPALLLLLAGCSASAPPLAAPPAAVPTVGAVPSLTGSTDTSRGTSANPGGLKPGETRNNSGGAVDLAATVRTPDTDGTLQFSVSMSTHSVGLDGYDLSQLAVLRNSRGQEVKPTRWDAPAGGHHRSGTLVFSAQDASGQALVGPGVDYVELVVRTVAGVPERNLRWNVGA